MSSGSRHTVLAVAVLVATASGVAWAAIRARAQGPRAPVHLVVAPVAEAAVLERSPDRLRVCADPNNLPFSNAAGEGFENALASVVARDLGRTLSYVWQPQRRGFLRTTLLAGLCDVVVGLPAGSGRVRTTVPYYRSSFVFVTRRLDGGPIRTFDDPRLRRVRIGIPVVGDDYANPPAAAALAARHITANVHGYSVLGDYSRPDPPRRLIDALAAGEVDVAVAWGPVAGFFARQSAVPLTLAPIADLPGESRGLVFSFDIAMGVRPDDIILAAALDQVLERRRGAIARMLTSYGVPLERTSPRRAPVSSRRPQP
jgi:mxaJ protein